MNYKKYNGYCNLYECELELIGENGKTAKVMTAWKLETGSDVFQLVSIYINH